MCACQTFALVPAAAARRQRCALTKTLARQWPKSWPSGAAAAAAISDAMSQQKAAQTLPADKSFNTHANRE